MKLVKFKYKGKHTSNDQIFLFDTEQEVTTYMESLSKLVAEEFKTAIRRYQTGDMQRSTFSNVCVHTGYTKIPYLATVKAFGEAEDVDPNILDVGIAIDKILLEKKETMLKVLKEGQIFCNLLGGFGNYKQALDLQPDIEPFSIEDITEEQMHDILWRNDRKAWDGYYKYNLVLYQGKLYYEGLNHSTHDYLIQQHRLPWDKTLKLVIDFDSHANTYGIPFLKLSDVYLSDAPPFEPSKQDLDQIENLIKHLCAKHTHSRFL